jgi:hypothetical protein
MDNIRTKDRDDADIAIAAKDVGGVLIPRNILTDPSGADLTPLTDAALRATPVPVSGTFWQATQPVSFTWAGLTDAQLRAAAVPVSGTFWQATQPVSIASMPTTPVTGTFWQATQPVSFTWAGLTDAQLRATAVPVSASALPLPTGAATETTIAAVNAKLPALDAGRIPVVLPAGGSGLTDAELRAAPVPIAPVTPPFVRVGFAEVGAGLVGLAAAEMSLLQTGAGMAVNQSGGNLVITTGTTVNSETVLRSVDTFAGSLLARAKVTLSQRIINQTFRVELADLVGDGLSYTINSATSITVTFPVTNPFTAVNVGQSLRVSRVTGAAGIPGRYAIASVSGLTINLTVAAWPASGSGTLSLYGWNAIWNEYSGTTATNSIFDAARRGWASGNTTATINTTAAPGHVMQLGFDVFTAGLADALVASNTGYQWTNRGSRIENIPDPDVPMYFFLIVQNGSTAPASTTTLTVGFWQCEDQGRQKVRIASSDPMAAHALPVQVMGGLLGTQPVSGTVTANIGTGALAAGANAIGDVGVQYRANATGAGSFVNVACPATPAAQTVKATAGRLLGFVITNTSASTRWLKVWNTAVGGITMGTTAALFEIGLPPGQPVPIALEGGIGFGTAISIAITGGQGLTNNAAVTLGDVTGVAVFA